MAMMGSGTATGQNRAAEAAARAISSPLLEDIDLRGAKGILVNIAAGEDMALGEYEAVGTAIGEYAAQNANVVIGTVLDAEMQSELRVTMVATGLADSRPEESAEATVTATQEAAPAPPRKTEPELSLLPPDEEIAAADPLELAATRRALGGHASHASHNKKAGAGRNPPTALELDMDKLDRPAFLRRQAGLE